jgi:hypothetical protein
MKKLLLLTLAIVTLTNMGYSQERGGIIVYERNEHGLVAAPSDLSSSSSSSMEFELANGYCDALILNGYDDWRLPTDNELNMLYQNQVEIGGFVNNYYWSSTEWPGKGSFYVLIRGFRNGIHDSQSKFGKCAVRCVRTF